VDAVVRSSGSNLVGNELFGKAPSRVLIMVDERFQVRIILFLIEKGHQSAKRRLHVADYPEVQPRAASEVLTAAVDLNDLCLRRIKLGVRKPYPA
jgi:hypothetical protein